MKKVIALILIIITLFTQLAFAIEADSKLVFSDLSESHWAFSSIDKLVNAGIIAGYPDGTFKPEGYITRAELVKIVNLIYSYTEKQETTNFTDIKPEDWYYDYILIAQEAGYIVGYPDGTFKPNDVITRQELCKILDSINNFTELPYNNTPVDEISPWAVAYVNKVISNRIMLLDENNNFRATEKATRSEVCDALAKFLLTEAADSKGSTVPSSNNDEELTKQELYEIMDTVTRRLEKGVIPELTSDAQKEIVNDIIVNMKNYQTDNNYDYEKSAEKTYNKYKALSQKQQEQLKELIQLKNTTSDLLELKEFFFPDVDIK